VQTILTASPPAIYDPILKRPAAQVSDLSSADYVHASAPVQTLITNALWKSFRSVRITLCSEQQRTLYFERSVDHLRDRGDTVPLPPQLATALPEGKGRHFRTCPCILSSATKEHMQGKRKQTIE